MSNHFTAEDNQKNLETITMKCNMKGDMTYMNEDPSEYPKSIISWNIEVLSSAFKEVYNGAAWTELIKFLDVDTDARDEFYFQSQEAFNTFMDLWNNLKPHNKTFPVEFLIANSWKNKKAHVICLDYAINYSYKNSDILFEKAKKRTEVLTTLQNIKPQTQPYLRVWKCIDLVQSLVNLSDSQYFFRVRQMFDIPLKHIPEYLLLTLIKIKTKAGRFLLEDLYSPLLPTFLTGHVNSVPILNEVWNADKNMMITAMSELYKINPKNMNLSRVLDITQTIKNSLLEIITISKDYNFTLQLGMLGAKRDFLHFEHWIEKLIRQEGDPFVRNLLKYIELNLLRPAYEVFEDKKKIEKVLERSQLTEERLQMIYENIHQIKEKEPELLDHETRKIFADSFSKAVKLFPSIHTEQSNNEEIEEKANEYFQQLYKGEKEVEDLIKIMKDFRSSQNATEREIYACMVQNLFDEWKFFPKYPKKELWMTARLFGKIICEKKIIDGVITDIGLKCIVEGLKREGKMFDFSITALEECKDSIEHETGLKNILTCKQLQEKKPELYNYIQNIYMQLHGTPEPPPIKVQKEPPRPVSVPISIPIPERPDLTASRDPPPGPLPNPIPEAKLVETNFNPQMARMYKPTKVAMPHMNTPTQPGKYFNDQAAMAGWKNTPQMNSQRVIYPPGGPPISGRPFKSPDNFSLGPSAEIVGVPRALNLSSKGFKPKTQQIQEYLKKDDISNLPSEFMDDLITILNMTGTEQIMQKAKQLEAQIKEEYIEKIAHHIVVKRVIDADEKRIDFYSNFFYWMKSRLIVKALIKECITVILRIIITESVDPNNKTEVKRAATTPIKNVACFLGYLTIVQNQPLLAKDLDLKQLLLEAHEKRWISIVMLVVCKILRTGENSKMFTPYNPWMLGLYSMLIEYRNYYLGQNPDTDKIINNEIQLVLKNRNADMDHIRESTLFRDFDQKNTANRELVYLHNKIVADPYINLPEIPLVLVQDVLEETKDEELDNLDQYSNAFDIDKVVIEES